MLSNPWQGYWWTALTDCEILNVLHSMPTAGARTAEWPVHCSPHLEKHKWKIDREINRSDSLFINKQLTPVRECPWLWKITEVWSEVSECVTRSIRRNQDTRQMMRTGSLGFLYSIPSKLNGERNSYWTLKHLETKLRIATNRVQRGHPPWASFQYTKTCIRGFQCDDPTHILYNERHIQLDGASNTFKDGMGFP